MGNYNAPFTPEQKAIMQSIADECYEQFVKIVEKNYWYRLRNNQLLCCCNGRKRTYRYSKQ